MLVTVSSLTKVVNEVEKQVRKVFDYGVVSYVEQPVADAMALYFEKDVDGRYDNRFDNVYAQDVETLVHLFKQFEMRGISYKLSVLVISLIFKSVLLSESHYSIDETWDNAREIANRITQSLPKNTFIESINVEPDMKAWGSVFVNIGLD